MKNNHGKQPVSISRLRLERLISIQEAIASSQYPNARKLAEAFDISIETIYDDIAYMIDRLNHPIAFDFRKNGYHYTKKFTPLIAPHASEEEVEAIHLLECACELLRGMPHAVKATAILEKLIASMSKSSAAFKDWKKIVSFHTAVESVFDPEIFNVLFKAAAEQQQLKMIYRKPGPGQKAEERLIETHHLAKVNAEWFIFAYDPGSQKMRTFIPSRIQSLEKTGVTFQRKRFSIKERLKHSFHIHAGDEMHDVRIEFNENVADYIRDKKWRCQQGMRELGNGGVELHLKLSSLGEIQRWLMTWSGDAIPTQPRQLHDLVLTAARKTVTELEKGKATPLNPGTTIPQEAPPPSA